MDPVITPAQLGGYAIPSAVMASRPDQQGHGLATELETRRQSPPGTAADQHVDDRREQRLIRRVLRSTALRPQLRRWNQRPRDLPQPIRNNPTPCTPPHKQSNERRGCAVRYAYGREPRARQPPGDGGQLGVRQERTATATANRLRSPARRPRRALPRTRGRCGLRAERARDVHLHPGNFGAGSTGAGRREAARPTGGDHHQADRDVASPGRETNARPWLAPQRETWRPDIRAAMLADQRVGIRTWSSCSRAPSPPPRRSGFHSTRWSGMWRASSSRSPRRRRADRVRPAQAHGSLPPRRPHLQRPYRCPGRSPSGRAAHP